MAIEVDYVIWFKIKSQIVIQNSKMAVLSFERKFTIKQHTIYHCSRGYKYKSPIHSAVEFKIDEVMASGRVKAIVINAAITGSI